MRGLAFFRLGSSVAGLGRCRDCPSRARILSVLAGIFILYDLTSSTSASGFWDSGIRRLLGDCSRSVLGRPVRQSSAGRVLLSNTSTALNGMTMTDYDTINPCRGDLELISGKPYDLGVLIAPNVSFSEFAGVHTGVSEPATVRHWFKITEWVVRQESDSYEPCDYFIKDQFAPDIELAHFQLLGDKQAILKIPPSPTLISRQIEGHTLVNNGTADMCCMDISFAFNRQGHQVPFLSRNLNPNPINENSSNPMDNFRGTIISSQMIITSVFEPKKSPAQDIFFSEPFPQSSKDSGISSQCARCQNWNATEFLGPELSLAINSTELDFQCYNKTQCAWSPALCNTCLEGVYSDSSMPEWFDRFVMLQWPQSSDTMTDMYNSSLPMTEFDKQGARRRACDTFCSTYYNIWYSGIDSKGNLMLSSPTSMESIIVHRPFRAFYTFQYLFGLSNSLLESLAAVQLV